MKSTTSKVTLARIPLALRALVCFGAAMSVTAGAVFAQEGTGPTCLDENLNKIDCATLVGNLGGVEGASVDCGLDPYKYNAVTGTYEREFNKFCAGFTNDANEVLFHGMSLLEAQQASEAAGLSGNQSVTQSNNANPNAPGQSTEASLSQGGPPELRAAQQYAAQQSLQQVTGNLQAAGQGQSQAEKESISNEWAGVFRFFFLGLQQTQQGRTQGTQSF